MKDVTQEEYYRGIPMVPFDLVKELVIAFVGVGALALIVSAILSSPDEPPVTIASWAQTDPVDFVTTATGELAGTTTSAGYGQPRHRCGLGFAFRSIPAMPSSFSRCTGRPSTTASWTGL